MATIAKVTAYDIRKCGYYLYGAERPSFGFSGDILAQLVHWVNGKTLRDTKLADTEEQDGVVSTYCLGITKARGHDDYILATWNETPTYQGQVASVQGSALVGNVAVSVSELPAGGIPGFPSYFYFIPERNMFFSVRFDGQTQNGQKSMARYLGDYLKCGTSYVITEDGENDIQVIGYGENGDNELEKVRPMFRAYPARKPGRIQWLRNHVAGIRKMVRSQELRVMVPSERTFYNSLMRYCGVAQPTPPDSEIRIGLDLDVELSAEEFDAVVDAYMASDNDSENVGFKMRGANDVHWLRSELVKAEISLDVALQEGWMVNLPRLAAAIVRQRAELLRLAG
jgi:hypothetical protein